MNQTLKTDGCYSSSSDRVESLEHTQVHVELDHIHRGSLSIFLYSPSGTPSEILSVRPADDSDEGINFTFMTVHNWGENPEGEWTLSITDTGKGDENTSRGKLKSWSLTLHGHVVSGEDSKRDENSEESQAHEAAEKELKELMLQEAAQSDGVKINEGSEEKDREAKSNVESTDFEEVWNVLREVEDWQGDDRKTRKNEKYSNRLYNKYEQNRYAETRGFDDTYVKNQGQVKKTLPNQKYGKSYHQKKEQALTDEEIDQLVAFLERDREFTDQDIRDLGQEIRETLDEEHPVKRTSANQYG